MTTNIPNTKSGQNRAFFAGLFVLCASTLMYEVVLTRLLSVICWYYMAFVSVSMAMFGMTVGALMVQLRPTFFAPELAPRRLYQAVLGVAISIPVSLIVMLSIPLDISMALQTVCTFLVFSSVIAAPFFFSGVAVCISLTRTPFPTGRVYFFDLSGAACGCLGAVGLLSIIDAPSATFAISAFLFLSAAAYAVYAKESRGLRASLIAAALLAVIAGLNSRTVHGIQPIWEKGEFDHRTNIFAEVWNPISEVRFRNSTIDAPMMWGPSPTMPAFRVESMSLTIDNDAGTEMTRFNGDLSAVSFLRYDVTSIAAQLRHGGTAAVIGVGGGRDVLNCAMNGFKRIVGIEVNSAIVRMTARKLDWYSGFSKIPNFELHNDEGRSYLTRSGERFDLIQASLVDTWAATSAGAMTLTENSLYTVDGWRVFYDHLKPGGVVSFSRWYIEPLQFQTYRLFSVAYATLLSEGVADPSRNLVLIRSGRVATLLVSNQPFTPSDIDNLRQISEKMGFDPIYLPGGTVSVPQLRRIMACRTLGEMAKLQDESGADYSPTFDNSPYFFNSVHLQAIPNLLSHPAQAGPQLAIVFLIMFFFAAVLLVDACAAVPAFVAYRRQKRKSPVPRGAVAYFVAIGLGFMCVEMAMMQQLSIFLGHPIYSMVVVLAGLILSTGIGSFVSDRWPVQSTWLCRVPAAACALLVCAYFCLVLPVIHACVAAELWERVLLCLLLIAPPGFALGFCFPVGLRWMKALRQEQNLPWMWALNGAAGTLGSFVAMLISLETSIGTCVLTGAGLYLFAAVVVPRLPLEAPLSSLNIELTNER